MNTSSNTNVNTPRYILPRVVDNQGNDIPSSQQQVVYLVPVSEHRNPRQNRIPSLQNGWPQSYLGDQGFSGPSIALIGLPSQSNGRNLGGMGGMGAMGTNGNQNNMSQPMENYSPNQRNNGNGNGNENYSPNQGTSGVGQYNQSTGTWSW